MKARGTLGTAALGALLALAPLPLAAQQAPADNTASETIGPPQLRDFNLNGAVTRPAPTPAPVVPPPAAPPRREPTAEPRASTPLAPPVPPQGAALGPEPRVESRSDTVALPSRDVLDQPPTLAPRGGSPFQSQPNADPGLLPPAANMPIDTGPSLLPWLLGALLLGAGALYLALRQRRRLAPAGPAMAFRAPDAAPRPTPPAPSPPPPRPSPPPTPGGVVSTALRPALDIEFHPIRAVVDDTRAAIEFQLVVHNSGGAPARDVLVEACMFNAGPAQEQEIRAFYAHPVGKGERIAIIMPLAKVELTSAVSLSREQLREFDIGGRTLFVPLIAFNALFRLGAGEGQTSTSFLVGRDTDGEKLAPLRLDLGPRLFRGLGARALGIKFSR